MGVSKLSHTCKSSKFENNQSYITLDVVWWKSFNAFYSYCPVLLLNQNQFSFVFGTVELLLAQPKISMEMLDILIGSLRSFDTRLGKM